MGDFLRFWTAVRLFDVAPGADGPAWERALVEHADAAYAAPDDAALKRTATAMLATIDPTPQNAAASSITARTLPNAIRTEDGVVIGDCQAIGKAVAKNTLDPRDIVALAPTIAKGGIVFDCRHFDPDAFEDNYLFDQFVANGFATPNNAAVPLGSTRVRMWDGYPPDRGSTSGGYVRGSADIAMGDFAGTPRALFDPSSKAVMVIDGTLSDVERRVALFRAAFPKGRVVQVGQSEAGAASFQRDHLAMRYQKSVYRAPDGALGLRPDACVPATDDGRALSVARALLTGSSGPSCATNAAAAAQARAAATSTDPKVLPSFGERMLALARLWGTIRYFHPYAALNDRSWDDALEAAIPAFAAASMRAQYEEAVMRLAARIDDSHVWMSGGVANPIAGAYNVPIYRRWIGNQLVVVGLFDKALEGKVRPGDVIVAIDGLKVDAIEHRFDGLIPASNRWSRRDLTARLVPLGPKDSVARLSLSRAGKSYTLDVPRTLAGRASSFIASDSGKAWRTLAPGIGYIDLTRLQQAEADTALDAMIASKVLILDMRGYPNSTAWVIAPRLVKGDRPLSIAAKFQRPYYVGPGDPQTSFSAFDQPLPPGSGKAKFKGRVIVMTDERAVSQSEHSILMYRAATPLTLIGTITAGANGDVTNVDLPGGLSVSFSGHDVRHGDGKQLQRVGLMPDIRVAPTIAGLAAGRDEVLERALVEARKR